MFQLTLDFATFCSEFPRPDWAGVKSIARSLLSGAQGVPNFLPDSPPYGPKACNLILLSLEQLLQQKFLKSGLTHYFDACNLSPLTTSRTFFSHHSRTFFASNSQSSTTSAGPGLNFLNVAVGFGGPYCKSLTLNFFVALSSPASIANSLNLETVFTSLSVCLSLA